MSIPIVPFEDNTEWSTVTMALLLAPSKPPYISLLKYSLIFASSLLVIKSSIVGVNKFAFSLVDEEAIALMIIEFASLSPVALTASTEEFLTLTSASALPAVPHNEVIPGLLVSNKSSNVFCISCIPSFTFVKSTDLFCVASATTDTVFPVSDEFSTLTTD